MTAPNPSTITGLSYVISALNRLQPYLYWRFALRLIFATLVPFAVERSIQCILVSDGRHRVIYKSISMVVLTFWGTSAIPQAEAQAQPREAFVRTETKKGSVFGEIVAVTKDGRVTLAHGVEFYLWGLHDLNLSEASQFLTNRRALCLDVVVFEGIPVRDCTIMTELTTEVSGIGKLSLFFWLEDLGIATHRCEQRDRLPERVRAIIHASGPSFACDTNDYPVHFGPEY